MSTATKEPEIPRIPIKIIRKDDRIKLTVDKYSLELIPLKNTSQSYDFLALEQFITKTASLLYQQIVDREQLKKDVAAAIKGDKK